MIYSPIKKCLKNIIIKPWNNRFSSLNVFFFVNIIAERMLESNSADSSRFSANNTLGGVLPIMAFTWGLCRKGAPFTDLKYMKGYGFY